MSGSLDHALSRQLFDELSAALEARGVRGHVYLIGGGAMITGYGRDRTTKDVDVRIDEAKGEVLAAARAVGEGHGLDDRWLDVGAAQFVPRGGDVRAKTVHNSPGLLVTGASAEHLLAMKVFAGRQPDLEDIKHLAGILGITRTSDAILICERAYPGWLVMERTRRNVGDAIADAREERGEPVPELTLARNTTLRAEGARSRSYEVMAEERADGSKTLHVTVRDPEAPDRDEQRPVRKVYGAPGPIRTLEDANAAVNAYERQAHTRDGMAPIETPVELKPVEVLRAEGERGRRYRAEWIRRGAAAEVSPKCRRRTAIRRRSSAAEDETLPLGLPVGAHAREDLRARWMPSPWERSRAATHASISASDQRTAVRPTLNGLGNRPPRMAR